MGEKPVPNFRMVERHFFQNKLMKSFDFDFGFCIPDSTNTCEHIYQFPTLTEAESKWLWGCGVVCVCLWGGVGCERGRQGRVGAGGVRERLGGFALCFGRYPRHAYACGAVSQMIASPWETKSDSFYFVDGCLVMHNKAEYSYQG